MPNSTRDRLTESAIKLFTDRGLSQVGINEITQDAGVARMSLYNNFPSKEALAEAAYAQLSADRLRAVDETVAAASSPHDAILGIFDLAVDLAKGVRFRGCAFIGLAAHLGPTEGPLGILVRHHKAALRDRFTQLAARDDGPAAERLGRQLLALWDGALSDAFIEGDLAPLQAAKDAAACLLQVSKR